MSGIVGAVPASSNPFATVAAWPVEPDRRVPYDDPIYREGERPVSDFDEAVYRKRAEYAFDEAECLVSQQQIADDLGCRRESVNRADRRLRAAGWMRLTEKRWFRWSRWSHNVYELLAPFAVSALAAGRIVRRAHQAARSTVESIRDRVRRGLDHTKRTQRARAGRGGCGCRCCRPRGEPGSAESERLRARQLARVRWRPTDPGWQDELEARLRRDGRDPLMAWMLDSSLDDLPDGRPWPSASTAR